MSIRRIYVEKKKGFDVEANGVLKDLKTTLHLDKLTKVRILHRYDIEKCSEELFNESAKNVFSEKAVDKTYKKIESDAEYLLSVEYLPGQYDQRADSAVQCMKLINPNEKPIVRYAKTYLIYGEIDENYRKKIQSYLVNPVDSRVAEEKILDSLVYDTPKIENIKEIDGFINWNKEELKEYWKNANLAMGLDDLNFCQEHFVEEKRNPTETEIKVLDTYWSDHCRHTTFATKIEEVVIEDGFASEYVKNSYKEYKRLRKETGRDERPETLMDLATIGMKYLRQNGLLDDLEISDEINACSVEIEVKYEDGKSEPWLLMFKNETHNHPTEIEPFGGAATCLGGAIRDPLSGRSYVYQAMRVTGASDPREKIEDTLVGKLPQRVITTKAAHGYSSYGNQIGLATGLVKEFYHPGYKAKRMEVGAVIAATKKEFVRREKPNTGDLVVVLGGPTGRDGCGGATGSSKSHTTCSIETCGAEVQKGNAPEERKIQRLFRNEKVTKLIKKCNDFGAGGVSVAIGELADSLDINLDILPKKYEGLNGTELSISESQERMAVVIEKKDVDEFIKLAEKENLEAVIVAEVKDHGYLKMTWRGDTIVKLKRSFLDSNGVMKKTKAKIESINNQTYFNKRNDCKNIKQKLFDSMENLNIASQKGLIERFDSTVGAGTVLMPLGGINQSTPSAAMVSKIPVLDGVVETVSGMSYGFDPYFSEWSPFHGSAYAVIDSVAKLVSTGFDNRKVRLSFQEYFEKLGNDEIKWGKPLSALLGALEVQSHMNIAAIGGKDSMSGTFNDIHVPPTLISFAVATTDEKNVISQDLKQNNSKLIWMKLKRTSSEMPDYKYADNMYQLIYKLINENKIITANAIGFGGVLPTLCKMSFGSNVGFKLNKVTSEYFVPYYGDILLEVSDDFNVSDLAKIEYLEIGNTLNDEKIIINDEEIFINDLLKSYEKPLESIFESKKKVNQKKIHIEDTVSKSYRGKIKIAKPKVFIPAFPGTNGEYDMAQAFKREGAKTNIVPFRNLKADWFEESINEYEKAIKESQIIAIPGGFSAGDEPDGSGKFIAAVFRNERLKDAIMDLLFNRDGLMLGICNGFQALVKLGLLPYGEIRDLDEESPTLTFNHIGRHISHLGSIKVCTNNSPWLQELDKETTYKVALSHGEGRFVANDKWLEKLRQNHQIGSVYVNEQGQFETETFKNPNGAYGSIESITALDGRILGKMGHSERYREGLYKNVEGEKNQNIFKSGLLYFR
jgi:phosphoribosylformylglycinamidine synthase